MDLRLRNKMVRQALSLERLAALLDRKASRTAKENAMGSKRELIDAGNDKRFVRRDMKGQF